jgi:23S rRNA maturation mini-RNase III
MKHMIPFLEDEELNELADKVLASPKGEFQGVTMANLLPFLDDDKIDQAVVTELKNGHNIDTYRAFMSDDSYHAIAVNFIKGNPVPNMIKWIPFLEDDDIDAIGKKVIEMGGNYGGLTISMILPFISDDVIDEAMIQAFEKGDSEAIKKFAPLASDEVLHKIAVKYANGEGKSGSLDDIYTFLDDDDIRYIFKRAMNEDKK